MKKILICLVAIAAAFSFGLSQADSSDCEYADPAAPIGTAQSGDPTSGAGSAAVCVAGTGSAEIGGDADAQTGYVYADGDAANEDINQCLDGFARIDLPSGEVTSDADGEFDPDEEYGDPDPTVCAPA